MNKQLLRIFVRGLDFLIEQAGEIGYEYLQDQAL